MDAWLQQLTYLSNLLLGRPETHVETAVLCAAGVLVFLLFLTKIGDMLGAGVSSTGRSGAVLFVSLAVWFAGSAALGIYAAPGVAPELAPWLPVAAAVATILVVSAPASMLFQRVKYPKAVLLTALSIGAAYGVILLAGVAFDAAHHGTKEGDVIKGRTNEMNDFLSK